jgi:hypothetical protein
LSVPRVATRNRQFPLELRNWALLSLGLGAVEGAVAAALVKAWFGSNLPTLWVDLAMALAAGAPAFANLASFWFAAHQLGRDKIIWTMRWQMATMFAVALLALAPRGAWGLLLVTVAVIAARVAWVGVITLRSVVWRSNFPDAARARLTSRLSALNAVLMAISGAAVGWLLAHAQGALPAYFVLVAGIGAFGALQYRRLRLRAHGSLRERERALQQSGAMRPSLAGLRAVLREDAGYRRYMQGMFVFGSGNLMLPAPLLLCLDSGLGLSVFDQVLLVGTLPLLVLPFAIMGWARWYDRVHIVEFRAVHAWSFVSASLLFLLGCISHSQPLLYLGAVMLGVGYAGGQLGWNLGHNDYARPEQAALYMGVHVSLTGIRGLAAPLIGVGLFHAVESLQRGAGGYALILPCLLNTVGAIGFVRMARAARAVRP